MRAPTGTPRADVLVAQPRGSVTPRQLATVGPHRDIDMEPSIKAHDSPARPAKQGFVVAKVKETMAKRRSCPPAAAEEASKRRDAPNSPAGWTSLAADPDPREAQTGRRDSTAVP